MLSLRINTDHKTAALVKNCCLFLLAIAILATIPLTAHANEIDELKAMIIQMEQRHKQELADLHKQVEALAKDSHPPVLPKEKTEHDIAVDFYDRLQKLERQAWISAPKDGKGFISSKNWNVNLGGELEFEFVKTDDSPGINEPDPHFQIDQLYLYPTAKYKNFAYFSADISLKTDSASIEEAWARFFAIPFNTYVEVGLNDLFMANIQRKTETEILIESAFYRDDDMGVRIGGKPYDWLYWEASMTNEYQLGTRSAGEDSSFPLIADRRNTKNASDRFALGLAVGLRHDIGQYGKIDILPFYYNGKLSEADTKFLQAIPGYGASAHHNKQRYGVNVSYNHPDLNFDLIGQILVAEDGDLNRSGWFIQPSYLLYKNPAWDWFKAYELVYRYNSLQVDLPHTFSNSLTWDRQQHVFGLLVNVIDQTSLKFEYMINNESTGAANVDNDEFLIQAEILW
ncbi:MAG: hypothetical protein ACU83U_02085 [Gammaproteobacteria bacterium]